MENKSDWMGVWVDVEFFRPSVVRRTLSIGGFCDFGPEEVEPDSEEMMTVIEKIHGHFISGKLAKEDSPGVWLSRSLGQRKVDIMIPWGFIRMALVGSPEQMKEFGFGGSEENRAWARA